MRLPAAESVDGVRTGREVPGSSPAAQDYFGRDSLSAEGRDTEGVRKDKAGAALGPFWRVFGAFGRFFAAPGQKVENPLPRELNPRPPLYFGGGVTATPGPRLRCNQTGPEPQLALSGALLRRPYPLLSKSGAYPRKKLPSAEIGLRPGPVSGKVHGHSYP